MATLPEPGELFEDKYRIEREIGSGGFAAVYRAVDEATRRNVAIKILIPLEHESDYSERLHARFEREARLLAGLRSQHIVTLYEFGQSEDGLLYLVFEYVDGTTLRDLVRVKGRQPPERVVTILRQICTALHEAHQNGILHRDIKPANVMVYDHLEMRDVVKLLDFGIAKAIGEDGSPNLDDQTITTAGSVLGTPRYMSPEQLAHQELGPSSDIYSLGLVAYELLTGERAISEETPTGILRAQLSTDPVKFGGDHNIPRGLRLVVEKMISKRRDDRYQDLAAVVRDLEHWDDADVSSSVLWLSIAGLALGAFLLVAALSFSPEPQVETVSAAPTEVELGTPSWRVPLDAPGVTFAWLASTEEYRLEGGTDPRAISPLARAVIGVERDGVPVKPGMRFVGDLLHWDGRSLDESIVVSEVTENRFIAMGEAQLESIKVARGFVSEVNQVALARVIELGNPVDVTSIGWTQWTEETEENKEVATDGLRLGSKDTTFFFAQAKVLRAEAVREWDEVIKACVPWADRQRFCAERVARAHLAKNEQDAACYWFSRMAKVPDWLTCTGEEPRPTYE